MGKVCTKGLQCQKMYHQTCMPSEDSDQPVHSCSLIRIFTGHILGSQRCKVFHAENIATMAIDKALFSSKNCRYLSYFSMKTYVVGTH